MARFSAKALQRRGSATNAAIAAGVRSSRAIICRITASGTASWRSWNNFPANAESSASSGAHSGNDSDAARKPRFHIAAHAAGQRAGSARPGERSETFTATAFEQREDRRIVIQRWEQVTASSAFSDDDGGIRAKSGERQCPARIAGQILRREDFRAPEACREIAARWLLPDEGRP